MAKLTVGQKLWYVPTRGYGLPCEVTITKVGSKWAELDNRRRLNMEAMRVVYGDSHCGECVIDRDQYETEQARRKAWDALRIGAHHHRLPETVTTDAIYQAAALLGIELPKRGEVGNG